MEINNMGYFSPMNVQSIQQEGEPTNLQTNLLPTKQERQEGEVSQLLNHNISNQIEGAPEKGNRAPKKIVSSLFGRLQVRPKDAEGARCREIFLALFLKK